VELGSRDWMYIFSGEALASAHWARPYSAAAMTGWKECPRADWLVCAAVRAGLPGRKIITVLHRTLSAVFEKREESGFATPPDVTLALDAAKSWIAYGERVRPQLERNYHVIGRDASDLGRALVEATMSAANAAAACAGEPKDDFTRVTCAVALEYHASNVLRTVAPNETLQRLFAMLVREELPWETIVHATTTSELSRRRRKPAEADLDRAAE
jgi:hypothetical protein